MGPSTTQIVIICLVIVLLFGASAIPKMARNLGKAKREFQKGLNDIEDDEAKKDEKATKDAKDAAKTGGDQDADRRS